MKKVLIESCGPQLPVNIIYYLEKPCLQHRQTFRNLLLRLYRLRSNRFTIYYIRQRRRRQANSKPLYTMLQIHLYVLYFIENNNIKHN
jgi:hypothetical protein